MTVTHICQEIYEQCISTHAYDREKYCQRGKDDSQSAQVQNAPCTEDTWSLRVPSYLTKFVPVLVLQGHATFSRVHLEVQGKYINHH